MGTKTISHDFTVVRNEPFRRTITFEGITWPNLGEVGGPFFDFQVRLKPDTPGDALIALGNNAPNAEGVALSQFDGDTIVTIYAALETIADLPAAAEVGADLTLYYDLRVTPADEWLTEVLFRGKFIVLAGVVRP